MPNVDFTDIITAPSKITQYLYKIKGEIEEW
jgi:hypothetical protein